MKRLPTILILFSVILSFSFTKKVQAISIRHDVPESDYRNNFSSSDFSFVGRVLNGRNRSFCSGSLLNPYFVLTSAHCVADNDSGLDLSSNSIRSSVEFFTDPFNQTGSVRRPVIGAVLHRNYALDRDGLAFDYALLRIAPIPRSTGISSIAPSRATTRELERFNGVVAGYGRDGNGIDGFAGGVGLFGVAENFWVEGSDAIVDPTYVSPSTFGNRSNFDRMLFADFDRPDIRFGAGTIRASNINSITLQCSTNPARFNKDCGIRLRSFEGSPTPGDSGGPVIVTTNSGRRLLTGVIQGGQRDPGVARGSYGLVPRAVRVTDRVTSWIRSAMRTVSTSRPFRVRESTGGSRLIDLRSSGLDAVGVRLYASDNSISVSSDIFSYEVSPILLPDPETETDPDDYSMWFENESLELPTTIEVIGTFNDTEDNNSGDDNQDTPSDTTKVPEPSTILGLLAVVGVGAKLKRQKPIKK